MAVAVAVAVARIISISSRLAARPARSPFAP
jgi:hypothetical protein